MVVNLCDLYTTTLDIDQLMHSLEEEVDRVYIGSYFCSQYFLKTHYYELLAYCKEHDMKVTLVVPVFTPKDLDTGKSYIEQLLGDNVIDEITVNDYGMLGYILVTYPDMKMNLGRLFNKDARDIRVKNHFENKIIPNLLSFAIPDSINYVEFDPTNQIMDFNHKDINIAMHTPFCYMSVGNICKFASIHQKDTNKFRPNGKCQKECSNMIESYMKNGYQLYRVGRAIYFYNKYYIVKQGRVSRFIYFPVEEVSKLKNMEVLQ